MGGNGRAPIAVIQPASITMLSKKMAQRVPLPAHLVGMEAFQLYQMQRFIRHRKLAGG